MGHVSVTTILMVLVLLFLVGMVKAAIGFGESLLTMPLLIPLLGIQTASPLLALVITTLTTLLLVLNWQHVDVRAAWRVMVAAVLGIPLGVWGLRNLPVDVITLVLGLVMLTMGLFYLSPVEIRWVPGPRWGYLFGFATGVLGAAISTGGPPVVIYTTLRRMPPKEFRATLQGCFTPLNFFILLGHALGGLWTEPVLQLYVYSLPVTLLAFWLGARLHHAIPVRTFNTIVYVSLVVLGVVMVGQSIF
jgi:uncharacterized membrane protein YfcA